MDSLDLDDIQGIIVRGYGRLTAADFVLLGITDPAGARRWLLETAEHVMNGNERPPASCLNMAFTCEGLRQLGLPDEIRYQFAGEFREGMIAPARQRVLGDLETSAPENWTWGGPATEPVHVLLMLYAEDQSALDAFFESCAARWNQSGGLKVVQQLRSLRLPSRKEHFGFRDGIAQPFIEGLKKQGTPGNTIKAGEILLGYKNEYDEYPFSPVLASQLDPRDLLPQNPQDNSRKDFGRNGSYLVLRQLHQDVAGFWRFVRQAAQRQGGGDDLNASIRLASQMVGRWPGGAPLAKSPDKDDPALADDDDFGYSKLDPEGLKCPLGSHIRRTNPRDSLEPDRGPRESLQLVNGRRIIRRGRPYGKPVSAALDPAEMVAAAADAPGDSERGVHFVCFNASIRRQFEFIQQTWINNFKFEGLYEETDPVAGTRCPLGSGTTDVFTIQSEPVRQRVHGLPRFVDVRGGAYFFMPGKRALKFLASLG